MLMNIHQFMDTKVVHNPPQSQEESCKIRTSQSEPPLSTAKCKLQSSILRTLCVILQRFFFL